MKIKFDIENNSKDNNETLVITRPWAEIIRMEGVQAGKKISAKATIKNITFHTVSPDKIKITGSIDIKTDKYTQKNSVSNIKLKWDKTLKTIPELQKNISLETLLAVPKEKPEVKQVKTIKPELKYVHAHTLINRLLIKGEVIYEIKYLSNKNQ